MPMIGEENDERWATANQPRDERLKRGRARTRDRLPDLFAESRQRRAGAITHPQNCCISAMLPTFSVRQ
jgi:hypothetical protein